MGRTSILSNEKLLREAASRSDSVAKCLEYLGLRAAGSNFKTLHKYATLYGIDLPNGNIKTRESFARRNSENKIPDELVFCIESNYNRSHLKKRIIKENKLPYRCDECSLEDTWNGKPISLQLDHINGIYNDNRLDNLRFLCPNCHSQTATFAGKSSSRPRKRKTTKKEPSNPNWRREPKPHMRKVERPDKQKLENLMANMSLLAIGRRYGVSDNAVRKWAKAYGLL